MFDPKSYIHIFIYVFQFYNTMGCPLRNKSCSQITWIFQLFLVYIWKYECNFTTTKENLSIWVYLEIFMLLLALQQTIIIKKKLLFHRSAVYSNKLTFKGRDVWKFQFYFKPWGFTILRLRNITGIGIFIPLVGVRKKKFYIW